MFYVVPFFWSFQYALTNNSFERKFSGLDNFVWSFQNPYYRIALGNTFLFTFLGVAVMVVFSLLVSVMLVSAGEKFGFLRVAFVLPILLPTAGIALIWRTIFNPHGVLLNAPALPGLWGKVFSLEMLPVYLLFLWKYSGFNIILITAAITRIRGEIYEAASLDGAKGWSMHRYITLPMIRPTLFFVTVFSMVNSFRIYKEIYYLFGDGYPPNAVYIIQYYMNNHFQKLNYQYLSSGAIIFALIVFIIVGVAYRLDQKQDHTDEGVES